MPNQQNDKQLQNETQIIEENTNIDNVVINKHILEDLIKKNQQIYNKNIEISIALMKTTDFLNKLLND